MEFTTQSDAIAYLVALGFGLVLDFNPNDGRLLELKIAFPSPTEANDYIALLSEDLAPRNIDGSTLEWYDFVTTMFQQVLSVSFDQTITSITVEIL